VGLRHYSQLWVTNTILHEGRGGDLCTCQVPVKFTCRKLVDVVAQETTGRELDNLELGSAR
jgi:hypothetical protein